MNDDNNEIVEKEVSSSFNDAIIDNLHVSSEAPKDPKQTSPKSFTPPLPFP